jgi:outer membrane protein assembly factor BamB
MKRTLILLSTVVLCLAEQGKAANSNGDANRFWPQWRGPLATGVAPLADPPLTWSDSQHVKWKASIPGSGDSTPIVWGDRVFILTAIPTGEKGEGKASEPAADQRRDPPPPGGPPPGSGPPPPGGGPPGRGMRPEQPNEVYQFVVLCLERQTGKTLWQRTAREEMPHEGHQPNNTFASASPVTDGQLVLAYFGSRGLHCYDMEGNLKWTKDFGHMQTKMGFGEGASPALYGDMVVVYWDDEGDHDFIAALDKRTGKELWRTPRDEGTGWSTPLVIDYQGKPQVVVNATGKVRSYDLASGKELWSCAGQTVNAIPSPVASADTVYVTSGFRGSALFAIRLGRTGDLTGTDAICWHHDKHTPYVPSPLLADGLLYVLANNNNLLSCFDAKTGAEQFEGERLEGLTEIYASPVAAKGRVYVLGRDGTCLVLKLGPKLEVLATNKLADKTDASIALAGKELFVRGRQYLYCIAEGAQ